MIKQTIQKKYLPEFVYGGMDGAVTTMAIISGAVGASLSSAIILIMGFANLIADGFSMAVANYFSTKSESELTKTNNYSKKPIKTGIATFISFILIGLIPLLSFILAFFIPWIEERKFLISIILTGTALMTVGFVKGSILEKNKFKSSIESLAIGGIAAFLAYLVGYSLRGLAS
jgi:VIT1/CCC1 family predicted Fe2+/Mn2+ transporter